MACIKATNSQSAETKLKTANQQHQSYNQPISCIKAKNSQSAASKLQTANQVALKLKIANQQHQSYKQPIRIIEATNSQSAASKLQTANQRHAFSCPQFYFSSLWLVSSFSLVLLSMEELDLLKDPTRENTLVGDCLVDPNLILLIPGEAAVFCFS